MPTTGWRQRNRKPLIEVLGELNQSQIQFLLVGGDASSQFETRIFD